MKNTMAISKQPFLALALAVAVAVAVAPAAASAQQASAGQLGITGTWNHQLTIRNCATGAVIAESNPMSSYLGSGVAIEMSPVPNPTLRTPSLGVWKYVGNQNYELSIKYFRYNPDGSFAGKTIIDSNITHRPDDTLAQVAVVRIFNPAGIQVASGCATLTSTRFTGND